MTGLMLILGVIIFTSTGSADAARPKRTPTPTRTPGPTATPQPGAGGVFQLVTSPNVSNLNNRLNGVAAVSAGDIWAVGEAYSRNGSDQQTLIQHYNGTSWQVVSSPNAASTSNRLLGVAAVSASDVWAVGRYGGVSGPNWQPLALHYNGSSWDLVSVPGTPDGAAQLNAVSATSPGDVWAVGSYTNPATNWWEQPLVMHYNGASWRVIPSPTVGTSAVLNGVAAISPNDVWAVGYTYSTGYSTLIMHWDGSSWSVVPSNGGTAARLSAVAAVSSSEVWAVGSRSNSTATLTMRWNGSSWSVVASPNGAYSGANQHTLTGLAVTAQNQVWAVGYSALSGLCGGSDASDYRTYTLALRWNGSSWQQALTVNPGGESGCNTPRNEFYGVVSAGGQAVAVGTYYDPALSVQFFRSLVETGQ